jgi:hypothetical protein
MHKRACVRACVVLVTSKLGYCMTIPADKDTYLRDLAVFLGLFCNSKHSRHRLCPLSKPVALVVYNKQENKSLFVSCIYLAVICK